jgi:hypothetical protein
MSEEATGVENSRFDEVVRLLGDTSNQVEVLGEEAVGVNRAEVEEAAVVGRTYAVKVKEIEWETDMTCTSWIAVAVALTVDYYSVNRNPAAV